MIRTFRLVLGIALCGAATAIPVAASAQPTRGDALVIKLISVTVSETQHDADPKGPSAGDWDRERSILYNAVRQFGRPAGARVGSDSGTMLLAGPRSATFRGTTMLPGGTLILRGAIGFPRGGGLLFRVAEGSGKFAHAKGSLFVDGRGKRSINIYKLSFTGRY